MKKGVEVKFRDKIVRVALNEAMIVDVMVEKIRGELFFRIAGSVEDTEVHHVWYYTEDLKTGDEIVIERKVIEKSTEPVATHPVDPEFFPKTKAELLQNKLRSFRALEAQLKEKGLI
ncbi:MAG: hypothetical protein LBQ70_01470 [Prevotellaceae bacterium]|jgi:hypothetical protein|nr:hypothetical protein [Prevotellaceae bacterium]